MNPDDIKRFEEALKDPKTWPTLEDLNDNRVFRDAASIASAERLIKDHRICLIRGAEGRGKTVLCRLVANEFHGRGWRVWMLDAQSVEAATDASAIASAMSPDGFGTDKTLLVVKNAHVGVDDLVPELLALLDSPGVSLLFTARKIFSDREDQITDDPFDSVVAKGCNIDLAPTVATVEEIIKSTLGWHSRLDYALDAEDRAWVAREFGHEMPNLRRLKWYLEYWLNRHDGRLATVTRDRVYGNVWSFFMSPLSKEPICQQLLLRIAAVFQFDVPFDGDHEDRGVLRRLVKEGLVSGMDGYRMQHSSDAGFLVEAHAAKSRQEPAKLTVESLRYYLQRGAASYYQLLRALRKTEDILRSCLDAPFNADEVVATAARGTIGEIVILTDSMIKIGRKPAAAKLWKDYKMQLGVDPEDTEIALKRKFQAASVQEAASALRMLRTLLPDEWKEAVAPSGVCSVEMLAGKIRGQHFGPVWGLLRSVPGAAQDTLLKTFDLTVVAKWFAVESTAGSELKKLVELMTALPSGSIAGLLEQLDAARLARQMIRSSRIMTSIFFLKQCHRAAVGPPAYRAAAQAFGVDFISTLQAQPQFLDELRASDESTLRNYLGTVAKFSAELRHDVMSGLGPDAPAEILLGSGLLAIGRRLIRIANTSPMDRTKEDKQICARVLHALAEGALTHKVKDLYETTGRKEERGPVAVLGRFLYAVWRLRRNMGVEDEDVLGILKQVPGLANCSPSSCGSDELSLLLSNLRSLEAEAADSVTRDGESPPNATSVAVAKSACTYDWQNQVSSRLIIGVVELMHFFDPVEPKSCNRIAQSIFGLDIGFVLNDSEPRVVGKCIWHLTHVDRAATERWVRGVPPTRWAEAISRMTTKDAFDVLSALYWLGADLVRDCLSAAGDLCADRDLVPEDIPLVGLLEYFGHPVEVRMLPPEDQIGEWIATTCGLKETAFAVRALRSRDNGIADESLRRAARKLYERGETYSIPNELKRAAGTISAPLLTELLHGEAIPVEPGSTFSDIAVAIRSRYPKNDWITFGRMLEVVCSASAPGEVFLDAEIAKKWLNMAIRAGIFQVRTRRSARGDRRTTEYSLKGKSV